MPKEDAPTTLFKTPFRLIYLRSSTLDLLMAQHFLGSDKPSIS